MSSTPKVPALDRQFESVADRSRQQLERDLSGLRGSSWTLALIVIVALFVMALLPLVSPRKMKDAA